jgi:two-component system LytT family sensor kinase
MWFVYDLGDFVYNISRYANNPLFCIGIMDKHLNKISTWLGSRLARNIYLWGIMMYFVLSANINNEAQHNYNTIHSPWYWWVIIVGMVIQMTLLYTNNLILIPRLLARKRYPSYFVSILMLVTVISIVYTVGLKIADTHIDVDNLQQVGFVSSPISNEWDWPAIRSESESYIFGNLLWVLVFTMAWYMNDYARQRKALETSEQQRVETELHFLKSQINPHFLFNTLNNIYGLSLKKSDNAPDVILKLSSILRYLLYDSNVKLVPFEKEQEIMQAYIDLELLRLPADGSFKFEINADRFYNIPPLIWLPILENTFKHSTAVITDLYFIDYSFTIMDNQVRIYSSNNYKASPNKERAASGGIGLVNLRKRLELLYPDRHSILVKEEANAFIAEVKIALV